MRTLAHHTLAGATVSRAARQIRVASWLNVSRSRLQTRWVAIAMEPHPWRRPMSCEERVGADLVDGQKSGFVVDHWSGPEGAGEVTFEQSGGLAGGEEC